MPEPQEISLKNISPLEVSLTFAPANRWPRLFAKSQWAAAFINDLPDTSFLYIEPGGEKDDAGKTTPRSLRHFPIKNKDGSIDRAHLTNAIARIPQADIPADKKTSLQERARKLLEQTTETKSMAMKKTVEDACKALKDMMAEEKLGDEEKSAMRKACKAYFKKYDENWDEDPDERAAVMATLREQGKVKSKSTIAALGELAEALAAKVTAHDAAVASLTAAKETAKKSVTLLEGEKPDLLAVVQHLAPLAGVTPKNVLIAQLPPELKAQWDLMQKSAADTAKALEEMQKSSKAQQDATRKAELVAKAAKQHPLIPGVQPEDIAALQMALPEASLPVLSKLLDATQGAMAKSVLFSEMGTAANRNFETTGGAAPRVMGGSTAHEKVTQMAREMVQKSAGKLTEAQARVSIYMQNPDLYAQHMAERRLRNVAP